MLRKMLLGAVPTLVAGIAIMTLSVQSQNGVSLSLVKGGHSGGHSSGHSMGHSNSHMNNNHRTGNSHKSNSYNSNSHSSHDNKSGDRYGSDKSTATNIGRPIRQRQVQLQVG